MEQREVVQDRVVGRNRGVVRQTRPRQIDARLVFHATIGADDVVGEPRLKVGIAVVDVFVGAHIDLAVRIHGGIETAMERFLTGRFERQRIECMHAARVVPRSQQLAVVQVESRIGGIFAVIRIHGRVLATGDTRDVVRTHDARQLHSTVFDFIVQRTRLGPLADVTRATVAEIHAVHHAIAVEPVVRTFGFKNRVGALTHIGAVQIVGHLAGVDFQIDGRDFRDDRRIGAMQIRIVDAVHPSRAIDGILRADIGVLAHGCSPQEARSTTKLTVVVALPPTLRVANRSALSTW